MPDSVTPSLADSIIIFVRNPVLGRVKTRLAREIGADKALAVYQELLRHTHAITRRLNCDRRVYYADFVPSDDIWTANEYHRARQSGADLGERMAQAFSEGFDVGYSRLVIIGSDCYELRPHHINDAFHALRSHDIVIGPARDGGYYLLGMKRRHTALFDNIPWSSAAVYEQTMQKCIDLGLSVKTLPVLSDVDRAADLGPLRQILSIEEPSNE